jgi:monoamine oxidase
VLEKMSEEERVAAAYGQARQIFPALTTAFEGGLAKCWGLDPWQRGSFALHTPGQIGFLDTLGAVEGRVHFAGEGEGGVAHPRPLSDRPDPCLRAHRGHRHRRGGR